MPHRLVRIVGRDRPPGEAPHQRPASSRGVSRRRPNKFLAKIASDLRKPDGYVVIEPGPEQVFLDPLPVGRIWGVGKVTGQVFDRLGIATIGQLRELSASTLSDLFGSSGEHYWRLARGLDDRKVVPDREAKSISHETTFAEDIADPDVLHAWLVELYQLAPGVLLVPDDTRVLGS